MFKLFLLTAISADVFSVVLTTGCDDHEEYSKCINSGCLPQNCSQLGYSIPCVDIAPEDCIGGYVCESGYLRADNGSCIPTKQCPSCNGDPHAESGCGTFCETCENYSTGPVVCRALCILNGCQCRTGYIYDQNRNKCVLPEQCTPTCKDNEVYSDCINGGCDARNCTQLGKPVPCVKMDPNACIKGCVCDYGYLRADNGTCIPKNECPSCGDDPNAESGCGTFCEKCSNNKTGPVVCPRFCQSNGCQCKTGFIYDQNINKCVLPKQCTPICKVNEVYSDCINGGCDARNCTQLGKPVPCVKMDPDACIKGCVCDYGYLRADNGTCIPKKECPSCGDDPNAESGCGTFCEKCSNYKTGPVVCPRFCQSNGCQCKTGFIYDQNRNKCVLPKQCTPTCKDNEVYSDCVNGGCNAVNCSQKGKPVPCLKLDANACIKGCVCKYGYLRAKNGTCIPEEQCPPTCNVNEVYSDCINGGCDARNCTQLGKPVPCVKMDPDACIKGCVCDYGYLRADNGTCIPTKECPSCGDDPNAETGCGTFCENCSNYKKGPIACPEICMLNGCQCKTGYIYDQNRKKCVLPEQCTPTCKDNEEYSECINGGCEARNCTQLGNPVPCVKMRPEACIKGCVCAPGYLRAKNGTCVPVKQCPTCGGDPNAESGCGVFCDRCSGPIPCPKICKVNGCQCKKGYIYDQNRKKCVLPKQCTPTCKDNEEYSDCINGGCDARNCTQLGNPVPCVKMRPEACIKGCICAPGYLRAKNGTCVPVKQCPTCGGDPNAESGCGVFCDRCSGPIPCPKICKVNGCQCKKGYIYDQNTEKCVLPKHCTPTCKSHEVYSDCVNSGCQARNCTQLGKPVPCILVAKGACIKGCVCESGYLRADNGTCIPENQCPKCKSGEEYSKCANGICRLQDCSQYGQPIPFCPAFNPDKCEPGCICAIKHLRNKDGVCVPQDECPEAQCQRGEVYSQCANAPGMIQHCYQYNQCNPSCQRSKPKKCKAACICKDGYLRNKKGVCIPRDECPEAKTTTTTLPPVCDDEE